MFNAREAQLPGFELTPSTGDIYSANFHEGLERSTLFSIGRILNANEANNVGNKLPPEEIRKQFGIETEEPKTALWAQQQVDMREEEEKRRKTIDSASGLWQKSIGFIGLLAGSASDPIDGVVGMAISAGIGKFAATGAMGLSRVPTKFIENLAGNVIANTANEAAFTYASIKEEREISAKNAFVNVLLSSTVGAGVFTMPTALSELVSRLGERNAKKFLDTTRAALDAGVSPNAVAGKVHEKINTDIKLDENLQGAAREVVIHEQIKDDLLKSKDSVEFFKKLNDAFDEGKISTEEVNTMRQILEESGYDPRKYWASEKNPEIILSEKDASDIQSEFNKFENDVNYNKETRGLLESKKEIKEPTIEENTKKVLAEESAGLDKEISSLEKEGYASKEELTSFETPRESKRKLRFEGIQGLIACAWGEI